MIAQWQIIDVETKKAITVGESFELVDFCKKDFDKEATVSYSEARILFGDIGATNHPPGTGVLKFFEG